MAKYWNNTAEVRNRLRFLGDDDTWDLGSILTSANRRVKTLFGAKVTEQLHQEYKSQTKYYTRFPDVHRFLRVIVNDEEVSSDNYSTPDTTDADTEFYIEFTDVYADDNLDTPFNLVVEYVPCVFVELELQLAIQEILTYSSVQSADSNEQSRLEDVNKRINALKKEVNRLMPQPARSLGKSLPDNQRWYPYHLRYR